MDGRGHIIPDSCIFRPFLMEWTSHINASIGVLREQKEDRKGQEK